MLNDFNTALECYEKAKAVCFLNEDTEHLERINKRIQEKYNKIWRDTMKNEKTYMFNADKYVEVDSDYDGSKYGFEILYDYINKANQKSRTIGIVHLPKNDGLPLLLGNDVLSMSSYNKPFATIYFNSIEEFNRFVSQSG